MEFLGGISSFFSNLPMGWLILGGLVIVLALDSLRSGVGRAIALSLSLPVAFVLFSLAQKTVILSSVTGLFANSLTKTAVFAIFVVALYFLIRRMGHDYMDGGMGEPIQSLFAGLSVAIVFVCVWLQLPELKETFALGGQIEMFFGEQFRLWWLLAAYGALAFARG